ncbi:hypothetical protein ACFX2G_006234 [Malus domestica]
MNQAWRRTPSEERSQTPSPNASDLGETLCLLNFASRVRGIESGPARKQADLSELENQLAEERKTRLKQETRAFAAVSHQSSTSSFREQGAQKTVAEKKPPLAPPRARLPLRRLSNFMPPTIICFTEKNLHCCQTSNSNNATGSSA